MSVSKFPAAQEPIAVIANNPSASVVTASLTLSAGAYQYENSRSTFTAVVNGASYTGSGLAYLETTASTVSLSQGSELWPDVGWTNASVSSSLGTHSGWAISGTSGSYFLVTGNQDSAGNSGSIFSSTDLLSWTSRYGVGSPLRSGITVMSGSFIAAGGGIVVTSTDLVTWTSRTVAPAATAYEVATNGSVTVAGFFNGAGASISYSTNLVTWTTGGAISGISFAQDLVWARDVFLIVGGTTLQTSTNALVWASRTVNQTGTIMGVAYSPVVDTFATVNDQAPTRVTTSTDLTNWTSRTTGMSSLGSLRYGYGIFVATGNGGRIYSSTDAITWTLETTIGTDRVTRAFFANINNIAFAIPIATSTTASVITVPFIGGEDAVSVWERIPRIAQAI